MKYMSFLLMLLFSLGCKLGGAVAPEIQESAIRNIIYVPINRFSMVPGPNDDLSKKSSGIGLFSAGVGRKDHQYWFWMLRASGEGKSPRAEIYKIKEGEVYSDALNIRVTPDGNLILANGDVLENWYTIDYGYVVKFDNNCVGDLNKGSYPGGQGFKWVDGSPIDTIQVQRAVLKKIIPACLKFFPKVGAYSLTIYKTSDSVYLVESWSADKDSRYAAYKFDKNIGTSGGYIPDSTLRLNGETLIVGSHHKLRPWHSMVVWKK
jgi:hypothetical protein